MNQQPEVNDWGSVLDHSEGTCSSHKVKLFSPEMSFVVGKDMFHSAGFRDCSWAVKIWRAGCSFQWGRVQINVRNEYMQKREWACRWSKDYCVFCQLLLSLKAEKRKLKQSNTKQVSYNEVCAHHTIASWYSPGILRCFAPTGSFWCFPPEWCISLAAGPNRSTDPSLLHRLWKERIKFGI